MKRAGLFAWLIAAAVCTEAQTTIFNNTSGIYSAGDLAGQQGWTPLLNVDSNGVPLIGSSQLGTHAFEVDNTAWVDTAGTDADFLSTTNGSFIYLDQPVANSTDNEWTFSFDFNLSLPDSGPAGISMANAEAVYIGLTAVTNGTLSKYDDQDICFVLRPRAEAGRLDVQFQNGNNQANRLLRINTEDLGWAPEAVYNDGTPVPADYQTDNLRLILKIRKSRDANTFIATGLFTNLVTGFSTTADGNTGSSNAVIRSTFATGAYAATNLYLAMGRSSWAYNAQFNGLLDLDVDTLSVVEASVPPALDPPQNVTAVPYDGQVTLSWDSLAEVSSYSILRSTMSGTGYSSITNVTGSPFVDSVANGSTYYYMIQAVYDGAGSSNSVEVSALPQQLFTGTVINTGFTAAEGYSDGDLAGQQGWVWSTNTDANAFNITNAATTGEASTLGNSFNATTNLGNAVYLDKLMDNAVDDKLVGSMDFRLHAQLAPGTNVAVLVNQSVLSFGLTADPNDDHIAWDDNKALLLLAVKADGAINAIFSSQSNYEQVTILQRGNVSWDPENVETNGVTPDDLVTETLHLDWSIRKTRDAGIYQATGTLRSSSATNTFVVYNASPARNTMYDSPTCWFTMGQYHDASKNGDPAINVELETLSVTHTNGLPIPAAPQNLLAVGGDRSVALSWDPTLEATGYDVLFAETQGGPQITIASNLTDATYLDVPRFNGVTNWYSVQAYVDTGSDVSVEVPGVPFASVRQVDIDGSTLNLVTGGNVIFDRTSGLQTNLANSVTYIDNMSGTPWLSTARYATWNNPAVIYALTQEHAVVAALGDNKGWLYRVRNFSNAPGDYFDYNPAARTDGLRFILTSDMASPVPSINLTAGTHSVTFANTVGTERIAIRNNGNWFVSQTSVSGGAASIANLADENWANVTITPGVNFPEPTVFNMDSNSTFTAVDAVGWYVANASADKSYKLIFDSEGSIPSTEYWMNQYASVSNLTDNSDGDILSNLKEYAFGGNPEDPNDVGHLPNFTPGSRNGTNGILYVHFELRDPQPGISYALETTPDLINQLFGSDATVEVIGQQNIDYYTKAVTNFIPSLTAAKFIDLKINQP